MTQSLSFTQNEAYIKNFFGFWLYLLTDCILFGTLLVTYLVLKDGTYGGPTSRELFHLPHALNETLLLLTSSLFAGLARNQAFLNHRNKTLFFYFVAFILGIGFLAMSYSESAAYCAQGYSWKTSAFLSAFFTVIWTHAFHILAGIIWIFIISAQIIFKGINAITFRRLSCLTLFWQFLALIWIFTFTIVYLMGAQVL